MTKTFTTSLLMGALMVSAAIATKAVTPTVKLADNQASINLAGMIPTRFGDWHVDESIVPLQVDPDTQARLDKIYNQTLSRTYVDRNGDRIMLSIAYGGDQSDSLAVHRPETCYTAQGFNVSNNTDGNLTTSFGNVAVRRLNATAGARVEPITYWITVGDKVTRPGTEQKLQQLRYGLTGSIPDGMLVRVSSISGDMASAYELQQKFVADMLLSLAPADRKRLIGS